MTEFAPRQEAISKPSVQDRLDSAVDIKGVSEVIDDVLNKTRRGTLRISVLERYRRIADGLPKKIKIITQEAVLKAAKDPDEKISDLGKKAFIILNMNTILTAIAPFTTENDEDNDEVLQTAVVTATTMIDKIRLPQKGEKPTFSTQLNNAIVRGEVLDHIEQRDHLPKNAIRRKEHKTVQSHADEIFRKNPYGLDGWRTSLAAVGLADETHYSMDELTKYLNFRNDTLPQEEGRIDDEEAVFEPFMQRRLRPAIDTVFEKLKERKKLTEKEIDILHTRYGLDDGEPKSLDETGAVFGLSRERIRQIESRALGKMKYGGRSHTLREFHE